MLAATVFGGFPLADFADAGMSAICIADGDARCAQRRARERLMDAAWEQRAGFALPARAARRRRWRAPRRSPRARCCCSTTPTMSAPAAPRTS